MISWKRKCAEFNLIFNQAMNQVSTTSVHRRSLPTL